MDPLSGNLFVVPLTGTCSWFPLLGTCSREVLSMEKPEEVVGRIGMMIQDWFDPLYSQP